MDEFETIYRKYSSLVYRYVLSLCRNAELAEEVTAEAFYNAYLHIGSFRGKCKIETWLCTIAKNALSKELKRRKKYCSVEENFSLRMYEQFDAIEDKDTAAAIYSGADSLKTPYKEVFKLRVIGELSFKQIADIYGNTESWAKITYYRAKAKIIDMMEGAK